MLSTLLFAGLEWWGVVVPFVFPRFSMVGWVCFPLVFLSFPMAKEGEWFPMVFNGVLVLLSLLFFSLLSCKNSEDRMGMLSGSF